RLPMAAILRQHQLHGDPQQQNAADDLEVRYAQQEYDEDGENDAQDDGGAGTTDDAPLALPVRQGPAGQGDDHGVVAAQQNVDPDDLEERHEELLVESYPHVAPPVRPMLV